MQRTCVSSGRALLQLAEESLSERRQLDNERLVPRLRSAIYFGPWVFGGTIPKPHQYADPTWGTLTTNGHKVSSIEVAATRLKCAETTKSQWWRTLEDFANTLARHAGGSTRIKVNGSVCFVPSKSRPKFIVELDTISRGTPFVRVRVLAPCHADMEKLDRLGDLYFDAIRGSCLRSAS